MGAEFEAIIEERTGTIGGKSSRRGQMSETLARYDVIRRATDAANTGVAFQHTNTEATGTAPKPNVPVTKTVSQTFEYVDIGFGK